MAKNFAAEIIVTPEGLKLYPYTDDMQALPVKDVKIEATATLPKKSKAEKITFEVSDDAFTTKFSAKGAHRYTLNLSISHQGKTEKIKFNVEPQ